MNSKIKIIVVGSLAIITLLISACGVAQPWIVSQPTPAPGYGYGPGMMGGGMMGNGVPGGMMGGGVPGGMMGGYGYSQSAPTAEPTPIGATPVPVDEEIQVTAANLRFVPTQIAV